MEGVFFKNRLYCTVRRVLIVLLSVVVITGVVISLVLYDRTKTKMEASIVEILEQSIEEDLNDKMSREHSAIQLLNNPAKDGKVSERTIVLADTVIKKMIKTGSHNNKPADSFLTSLKFENRLHTDTVSIVFQDNLRNKGINVTSFILLKFDETTEISGDTTSYSITYRTPIVQRGFLDDVTFQGLVHYTPLSVLQLIPRYLFYIFIVVIALISISIVYLSKKINAIRPDKIMKLKNGDYYIGQVYFDKEKMKLKNEGKTVSLSPLMTNMLEFFLESNDLTANKTELQDKFWQTSTSYNSMTSAINRLRTFLNDADSTFKIITPKGSDFYMMVYDEEEGD